MDDVIEDYFKANYPAGTLPKIRAILKGKSHVWGFRTGLEETIVWTNLTLVFYEGTKEMLQPDGQIYDYIILAPEKYPTKSTFQQMEDILRKKGQEPVSARYAFEQHEEQYSFGPIEIPYDKIKALLPKIPYFEFKEE